MNFSQLLLGLLLGPAAGIAAYRAGALDRSGAAAAALTGAAVLGFGGWAWAAALLAFFVSSSLLSRLFTRRKAASAGRTAKGGRRDWAQVAANGGLAAVLALIQALLPQAPWPWAAALGALAAANADTWATELGVLSRRPPRRITTGRIVPPGTSGGVSLAGFAASAAGAALVGAVAFAGGSRAAGLFAAAAAGGFAGSLLDSVLGATVQAVYRCTRDGQETEQHPTHSCGAPTLQIRGLRWLNNDLVNLAASAAGAGVTLLLWQP